MTQNIVYGINPVFEILNNNLKLKEVNIQKNKKNPRIEKIIKICKQKHIKFSFKDKSFFETNFKDYLHQGIVGILKTGPSIINSLEDYTVNLTNKEHSLILVLDGITDVQNIGSISRSAYFFGTDLIILSNKHSAPINETVHKTSSGASLLLPYYYSNNFIKDLNLLKDTGYTVYTTFINNDNLETYQLQQLNFNKKSVIVFGSENKGIKKNIENTADVNINIPGGNNFNSLNVSNTVSIFLYKYYEQII